MTDVDLRQTERALVAEPASLDLRRLHARLLQRAGDEERALSALDLAWRLGADDLWDALEAALTRRRRRVGITDLGFVPAGPFAMGADDLDDDVAPAHLVTLPGYFVAIAPLRWGALEGFSGFPEYAANASEPWATRFRESAYVGDHAQALAVVAHLNRAAPKGERWALPTEAQWERAVRASYLRPDGRSPYGVVTGDRCEWTGDRYWPDAYAGPDRGADPKQTPLWAVRGVPALPPPHHAVFREAAGTDGRFRIGGALLDRQVGVEEGIAVRPVLVPAS